jgi:hypothetical protein
MRKRARRVREGQAREGKKEGKPALPEVYDKTAEINNGLTILQLLFEDISEGVDWPNCRKCSFLIFIPTCNHVNLNFVKKDHVHQKR